jgi:hypothetical protein
MFKGTVSPGFKFVYFVVLEIFKHTVHSKTTSMKTLTNLEILTET